MSANHRLAMLGSHLQTPTAAAAEFPMLPPAERSQYDGKAYYATSPRVSVSAASVSGLQQLSRRNQIHLNTIQAALQRAFPVSSTRCGATGCLAHRTGRLHKMTQVFGDYLGVGSADLMVGVAVTISDVFAAHLTDPVYVGESTSDDTASIGYDDFDEAASETVESATAVVLQAPFTDAKQLVEKIKQANPNCRVLVDASGRFDSAVDFTDWGVDGMVCSAGSSWSVVVSKQAFEDPAELGDEQFHELDRFFAETVGSEYIELEVGEIVARLAASAQ